MEIVRESRGRDRGSRKMERPPGGALSPAASLRLALILFSAVVLAGPILFGALDRFVQIPLLLLFAAGLALCPAEVPGLGRRGRIAVLALASLLIAKEFAPAALFGHTAWRDGLSRDFGVPLGWMHHPEPGRALEGLLVLAAGILWFQWVRTLAGGREQRAWLCWSLFGAAAAVAVSSFFARSGDPQAIFGLRHTPGWTGFGPFPNRNHTASLLAMGLLVGAGCITHAARRRRWRTVVLGAGLAGIILFALFTAQSRGGLVALGAGLAIFAVLGLARLRSRAALLTTGGAAAVIAALVAVFGGSLVARFTSASGAVSNDTRKLIWQDTVRLWQDAPLFGHGLGSFASVFPWYQQARLPGITVLHAESSWLQALADWGAIPLALAVLLAAWFLFRQVRVMLSRSAGFFLAAGCFAAFAALACHSLIDVPGQRWGTAGFALAALAVACVRSTAEPGELRPRPPWLFAVPAVVALFWTLPFLVDWPRTSPSTLARLLARESTQPALLEKIKGALSWFPLDPSLHATAGRRMLASASPLNPAWLAHFRVAVRLRPNSSVLAQEFAWLCKDRAPGAALHFWQIAIERAGDRRAETLQRAITQTARLPGAAAAWAAHVEVHPDLLLAYAGFVGEAEGYAAFRRWWDARAMVGTLSPEELASFYRYAPRWLAWAEWEEWTERHVRREKRDFVAWATILQQWRQSAAAWEILARHLAEPPWPARFPNVTREYLEQRFRQGEKSLLNTQALAAAREKAGDKTGAEDLIVQTARLPGAPLWFTQRAAHVLARRGTHAEAVALLLGNALAPR